MSSKIRFAADSDVTAERCTVRMLHSGNITLAPVEQSSYRIRGQNKDPTTTDFISPEVQEAAMPPASVYFLIGNGGTPSLGDPLEHRSVSLGGTSQNAAGGNYSIPSAGRGGASDGGYTNAAAAPHHGDSSYTDSRKSILTIFFQGKSNLVVPHTPVQPRIQFPSQPLSMDPPKMPAPRAGDLPTVVPSADVLSLAEGPDQSSCPYELRARNIEPRIHITATANNSICTFSTNLHDHLLFEQNGSAVGPKYGRAFGVMTSMNIKGLVPTAICMSYICALVTTDGAVMSAPSSPLGGNGRGGGGTTSGGSAYNAPPTGPTNAGYAHQRVRSDLALTNPLPAQIVNQWYDSPEEGSRQHKILADALQQVRDDYRHGVGAAKDGGAKARLSWQTTKSKDDAIIRASKYTATIAFEPILIIGVHTGSIDVISLTTQKELFRFNTGDVKGSKIIEGYACCAIECVHSMAQSSVSAVLKAVHALEGRVWTSGGHGSTRATNSPANNPQPTHPSSGSAGASPSERDRNASYAGGGPAAHARVESVLNSSVSSINPICSGETPIRSVYAAGYDNGEVLLLAISKTSGEVLRRVSYGTRPISSIRVGCLPWELHIPHPYSKHNARNPHKPSDVNGSGCAASGTDFFQLVWQQRDEFLFEMSGPTDVQRLLASGPGLSNDVSLTPPRSISESSSIVGDDTTPGSRYPEDHRNEPLPTVGSSPSPAQPPLYSGGNPIVSQLYPPCNLPTAVRLSSAAFLRRSAFWNNFALVCTAGGCMHLVATSLSDAGERAEVRTVEEVSIQKFKSFGAIVSSKLLFTVAPGSLAHAECVRRDPAAQRQQLTYMAVTTQTNTLLIFRLAISLSEDAKRGAIGNNISGVDIQLVARRDAHRSWINSLAVLPLPNNAFGFAGTGAGGLFDSCSTAAGGYGNGPQRSPGDRSSTFHTPNGKAPGHQGGGGSTVTASRGGDLFHRSSVGGGAVGLGNTTSRSGAFGQMMDGNDGGCYEPMMPFALVALGMDQKLTFWICEASLDPPLGGGGGGAGGLGASPESGGQLMRTRSGRLRGMSGSVRNTSFNTSPQQLGGQPSGLFPSAPATNRLPISFTISQDYATTVTNATNNTREEFEPWASIASCGLDGHQTFMCLGLRGKAKFYDVEIEENSGRNNAPSMAGGGGGGATQGGYTRSGGAGGGTSSSVAMKKQTSF